MSKKVIYAALLTGISLLTGCSVREEPGDAYNWKPPIENVNWGQNKEEVFEEIGIQEDEAERLAAGETENMEYYTLEKSISFLGENAQTTLAFDPDYGLVRITFAFEKENVISELIPKIQEAYPSDTQSDQTGIYGSVPDEMEDSQTEKYRNYLEEQGMDETQIGEYSSLPLVIIDYNADRESPFFNTCNFNAGRAALWEHAMG